MKAEQLKKQHESLFRNEYVAVTRARRDYTIACTLKHGDMSASISVRTDNPSCAVTEFDLINELHKSGVRVSIDFDRISQIVKSKRFNQDVPVAAGVEPENGEPGRYEPAVTLEEFTTAELLRQFPGQVIRRGVPVELDEVLMEKIAPTPGVPGFTVRGRKLLPVAGDEPGPPSTGEGIAVSEDGAVITAAMPGMAGLSNGKLEVKDAEYEEWKYEIKFRKDNMEAVLVITPGLTQQPEHDEAWFNDLLNSNNIKFGVERIAWRMIPQRVSSTHVRVIAEGEPPLPDEDAQIIERFREGAAPGQALFPVSPGQVIAEKQPVVKGVRGRNVFDEPVDPPPAKDVELKSADGAHLDDDGMKVIADIEGYVCRDKHGVFSVAGAMTLNPDDKPLPRVVNYDGVVCISGGVPRGHTIIAGRHVEITGDVQQANVVAGGVLHIHGRVQDCMNTKLQAGEDIHVGSARTSRLRVEKDLYVGESLQDCEVICGGGLQSRNGGVLLKGGRAIVAGDVRVQAIEKSADPPVILAGAPFPFRVRANQLAKELDAAARNFRALNAKFIPLHKKLVAKNISQQEIALYKKLRPARDMLVERLRASKALLAKIQETVRRTSKSTSIFVSGSVQRGALITIGQISLKPDMTLKNCSFYLSEDGGEIIVNKM